MAFNKGFEKGDNSDTNIDNTDAKIENKENESPDDGKKNNWKDLFNFDKEDKDKKEEVDEKQDDTNENKKEEVDEKQYDTEENNKDEVDEKQDDTEQNKKEEVDEKQDDTNKNKKTEVDKNQDNTEQNEKTQPDEVEDKNKKNNSFEKAKQNLQKGLLGLSTLVGLCVGDMVDDKIDEIKMSKFDETFNNKTEVIQMDEGFNNDIYEQNMEDSLLEGLESYSDMNSLQDAKEMSDKDKEENGEFANQMNEGYIEVEDRPKD